MLISIFLFAIAATYLWLAIHVYEKSVKKYYWHASIDGSYMTFKERREVLWKDEWKDSLDFTWSSALLLGLACFAFYQYAFDTYGIESIKFWTCIVFAAVAALTYFVVVRRKILSWEKWTLTVKVITCLLLPIVAGLYISNGSSGSIFS